MYFTMFRINSQIQLLTKIQSATFFSFVRHFISASSSLSIKQILKNFNQSPSSKPKNKKNKNKKEIKISMKKSIKNSRIIIYFPSFSKQPNRAYQ